ncbi:MAG: hypothetical protein ACYS21_19850 [Planctomycetota bacterium]
MDEVAVDVGQLVDLCDCEVLTAPPTCPGELRTVTAVIQNTRTVGIQVVDDVLVGGSGSAVALSKDGRLDGIGIGADFFLALGVLQWVLFPVGNQQSGSSK